MDSTPVLVISGNEVRKYMGARTRVWGVQGYDSVDMVKNHCKYAERYSAPIYLDAAYNAALKPRQGPSWVDIPKDLQNASV